MITAELAHWFAGRPNDLAITFVSKATTYGGPLPFPHTSEHVCQPPSQVQG